MGSVFLTNAVLLEAKKKAILSKVRDKLTDTAVEGMRVNVYPSGEVTLGVSYSLPNVKTRMEYTFGSWPEEITIAEARDLTQIVRSLAAMGVDVRSGLQYRLTQELKRDGLNWRMELSPPAPKRRLPMIEKQKLLLPPAPRKRRR